MSVDVFVLEGIKAVTPLLATLIFAATAVQIVKILTGHPYDDD